MTTSSSTVTPILPKLAPAPKPVPVFFVPISINLTGELHHHGNGQISIIRHPPAPPPLPPPSLLKQKPRRRIPILIDQKSLKKNLHINKQTLQTKLASRPEPIQLIERGILQSEEEKLRRFQHRENIRSHIQTRPTRETLVTQGILLNDACIDPLIRVRGQLLKRNKLVDNLNNKLRKRPGPLELVNRKILQVDAELEQAIQEGQIPFTPTFPSPSSSPAFGGETTMISTIIPPPPIIRHDDQQQYSSTSSNSATNGPKAKIRKKSQQLHRNVTPYENTSASSTNKINKLKAIANGKRLTNDSNLETSSNSSGDFSCNNGISPMETDEIHGDSMLSETNYEINMKQQQLFLQWQDDHYKNPHDTNSVTPAMSSTTSNCSTPLHSSNDTPSIHSSRSSFSVSSTHSGNQGNTRFSSIYSPSVSPAQAIIAAAATTATTTGNEATLQIPICETEKPKSKLADLKVSDLKGECKKRQLPVSGAKPQLLERLKPYEDAIVASLNLSSSQLAIASSSTSIECSNEATSSTSAGTCQASCNHQPTTTTIYCQTTKPSLPAQDVITDYLQQCQPQQQQQQQQKPLVLQLPPNSKPPQLVQLVDSNGTVLGVAAMPHQSPPKKAAQRCCTQCKKQPDSHATLTAAAASSTTAEPVIQSTSHHESKINEPTFSFSQMGSGGQFTLANSSPIVSECRSMQTSNCASCLASQSSIKIVTSDISNSSRANTATSSSQNVTLCNPPPLIRSFTSSTMPTHKSSHSSLQKSESNSSTVERTVASVAHRRHSIPASVFSQNEELADNMLSSPDQVIGSPNNMLDEQEEDNDTNLEEIDPNVLLTAKTFSQHDENLRTQQRLIEDLQGELAKAQEQLRREQKLIIAAKKLQLRPDPHTGKLCTQAEILLNNLDVKQINKQHIQHFIQYKAQQQNLQAQTKEYQQQFQVEHKLQDESHMEQSIQDIVRLIKQDGRNALLLVQLLRRYQLERNHQFQQMLAQKQQASSIKLSPSTSSTTISGQSERTHQQQECTGRTSVMSSKSIPNNGQCRQHQTSLQHPHATASEGCCANPACKKNQQKSAQIVVIDDSPASSPVPAPAAAVPTVVETLPKPKESGARSKSQNGRTNKRKSNGSRSIWAKTNLIEKSASFTNASQSKVIDMEEIFRTVINSNDETPAIENQPQIISTPDASSELVPQLNGFHLVANSDDSSNSAFPDDQMDHTSASYQQQHQLQTPYPQKYILHQPMQTEICSTTAIFTQPENISSVHADCYSKPRNENSPERVEIIGNGYVQTTQQFVYPKNDDFEDLMDVLRDDQECPPGHMMTQDGNNCGKELLGYTTAELATFLASDENIINNGNIYDGYDQEQQQQQQQHYAPINYQQQQCIVQQNAYQNNIEYEVTPEHLQHLNIEPHQEQAIDDILNSDMIDTSVEWFDQYFQSPMAERQITSCGGNRSTNPTTNIHRPMDAFV